MLITDSCALPRSNIRQSWGVYRMLLAVWSARGARSECPIYECEPPTHPLVRVLPTRLRGIVDGHIGGWHDLRVRCLIKLTVGVKHPSNPILGEEPPSLDVTGFRDPYLAPWPAMDLLRGESSLYGLISGGLHGGGPQSFLYSVDPSDISKWTYLHPLVKDTPPNYHPSVKWSGDFGRNWECTNFHTFRSGGYERHLLVPGSEGGHERASVTAYRRLHPGVPARTARYSNWFFGTLARRDDGEVRLGIEIAGLLDWGLLYAFNTFVHPDGRIIAWGWAIEEDLSRTLLAQKGWAGCLGVPREIFLSVKRDVSGTITSSLADVHNCEITKRDDSTFDVLTLGVRPIVELASLRKRNIPTKLVLRGDTIRLPLACEIHCVVDIKPTSEFRLHLRVDATGIRTSIVFSAANETLSVLREASTRREDINTCNEIGSHTLFVTDGVVEPLDLRVFMDLDLIEVFANERFSLTTRVYAPLAADGFVMEPGGEVRMLEIFELGVVG